MNSDRTVRTVLESRADGVPYDALARDFLEHRRWTGTNPPLLVAEAAAASTGQGFVDGVKPAVERFRDAFVATDRVNTLADLAAVDLEDEALVAAMGARRKRRVLLGIAAVLAARSDGDDFAALVDWAETIDHYRYEEDPIGAVSGVGPSTVQYLRQLAGVDTVRPDPTVETFLEAVDAALERSPIETSTPRRTIASCEWLAFESGYRPLELDRIAWWTGTDADERAAVLEAAVGR